jgi:hypothetical protein
LLLFLTPESEKKAKYLTIIVINSNGLDVICRDFHFFLMCEREREREREKKERERDRKREYLTKIVINSNNMDVNRRSSQCLKTHSFLNTCKKFFLLFFSFSCIIGCLNKRKSKGFNKIFILSDGKMSTNLAVRTILMKYFAI